MRATSVRLLQALLLFAASIPVAGASIAVGESTHLLTHQVDCELPVRLVRDCSAWQGATRPIAFADFRMSLAADDQGSTVLLSRVRPRPDHNGSRFSGPGGHKVRIARSLELIDQLGLALREQGIRLERVRPVRHGDRVTAYYLTFSDNAYDFLREFTVLESEFWLPRHDRSR